MNHMPSFMLINARSLTQNIDELGIMLNSNDTDITAITETWFPPQVDLSVFYIPN